MNTNEQTVGMVRWRSYGENFKADAVAACLQAGMSMAAVALSRGLKANLLRHWVVEAERTESGRVSTRNASVENGTVVSSRCRWHPRWRMPMIRIEVRSGSGTVIVQWLVSAASECAALLRELTR